MLRHTNTGGVSVLYVAHFGREREGGVAVNKKREKEKKGEKEAWERGLVISFCFIWDFLVYNLRTATRPQVRRVA